MIKELDIVVLSHDLEEFELEKGDIGTAVHVYDGGTAYEVEFVTGEGETIALVTLTPDDVRPMGERDILHVRTL